MSLLNFDDAGGQSARVTVNTGGAAQSQTLIIVLGVIAVAVVVLFIQRR